jgi:hypothetical protein
MTLEEFDKLTCRILDDQDIKLTEEILAQVQYRKDFERFKASEHRVKSLVIQTKQATVHLNRNRNTAYHAGLQDRYLEISARRRQLFSNSSFSRYTSQTVAIYNDFCKQAHKAKKRRLGPL